MKLTHYVPAGMNADGTEIGSFETTEELLSLPLVRRCLEFVDFHQFFLVDDLLMAETNDGLNWWIVGRIDAPEKIDLPKRELPLK